MLGVTEMKHRKEKMGYTNAMLSELSGIPLGTINKIFSGETKRPRYENLEALDRILNDTTGKFGPIDASRFLLRDVSPNGYYATKERRVESPAWTGNQGPYTIDDYEWLSEDKRIELINGFVYDIAAPSVTHQRLIGKMYTTIANYITAKGGSCEVFMAPTDVHLLDEFNMFQPDVFIVCNPEIIDKARIEGSPDFVLEVVSKSNKMRDYAQKTEIYCKAGVREYWILDPFKKVLVIYLIHNEDDFDMKILPLEGKVGVHIYDGDLQIDLDALSKLIMEE